jgi:hypothetical protein
MNFSGVFTLKLEISKKIADFVLTGFLARPVRDNGLHANGKELKSNIIKKENLKKESSKFRVI